MTLELEIEEKIAEHLRDNITDFEIESYTSDIETMIQKAKENHEGLITVCHSNDPADYDYPDESKSLVVLKSKYVITILVNDRQEKRTQYVLVDKIRSLMLKFDLENHNIYLSRHAISQQKFPDILDGIYIGEVEIIVETHLSRY